MKRLILGCLLVGVLVLAGCGTTSPATYVPLLPNTDDSIVNPTALMITTERSLSPVVNIDFNKQLTASVPNAKWSIRGGELPTGTIKLSDLGLFSGVPSKLGETGSFTVQATVSGQTVSADFTFRIVDGVWLNPAMPVVISNFHAGARAEYSITIHNDESVVTEQKRVITEASDVPDADGFITVPIPINQNLHEASVASVLAVASNNSTDHLKVVSYDKATRTATLRGFIPLADRIIALTYVADSTFMVQYETVDLDVHQFVTVADSAPVLAPHETRNILVAIEFPEGYNPTMVNSEGKTVPVKDFSFRILTGRNVASKGNVTVAAVNAATFQVHMR